MKNNKFPNLFAALVVGAACVFMTGCSEETSIADLAPGAYINKTTDTTAQIIVVANDKTRKVLDGDFKINASGLRFLRRLAPVSMTATYEIKTTECGVIKFLETPGGVICESCMTPQPIQASFPNCPRGAFEMYQTWTSLGI